MDGHLTEVDTRGSAEVTSRSSVGRMSNDATDQAVVPKDSCASALLGGPELSNAAGENNSTNAAAAAPSNNHATYSAGQLVWVRVGKTEHHAHIVAASVRSGDVGAEQRCSVKWCSTGGVEEVDRSTILPGLSPRKRRRNVVIDSDNDGIVNKEKVRQRQKKMISGGKRSGSRLSFGRNRKKLAKSRGKNLKRTSCDTEETKKRAADSSSHNVNVAAEGERSPTSSKTSIKNVSQHAASSWACSSAMPAAVATFGHNTSTTESTKALSPKLRGDVGPDNSDTTSHENQFKPATKQFVQAGANDVRTPKASSVRTNTKGADLQNEQEQLYKTPEASPVKRSQVDKRNLPSSSAVGERKRQRSGPSAIDDSKERIVSNRSYHDDPASSAYVQHLSEMSYTILNDMRWRVPVEVEEGSSLNTAKKTRSVLAWETGDDLSAIAAFAGLWDGRIGGQSDRLCPGFSAPAAEVGASSDQEVSLGRAPCRALNLYSRLFVRKGPWFTVDDLYFRYYRRYFDKSSDEETVEEGVENNTAEGGDDFITDTASGDCNDDDDIDRAQPLADSDQSTSASKRTQPKLADHRTALIFFFIDLIQLHRMRLLRTFDSERECGIVAGNTTGDGAGLLLNAASRSDVLNRLGGGKKIKGRRGGLNRRSSGDSRTLSSSSINDRRRSRSSGASENLIWRQMTTQKSVLSSMSSSSSLGARGSSGGSESLALLPVQKHVHEALWKKFAARILGSVDVSSDISIGRITSTLIDAWSEAMEAFVTINGHDANLKMPMSSIRLREAPALSLRRASRLYLCAGGGPGSMRGDAGTSGWASVLEHPIEPNKQPMHVVPSEARRILDAGGNSWHKVAYPGLSARFGLSIFSFVSDYEPLLQKGTNAQAQVFPDINSFCRWETCAELRATFDHLLDLNDIIHYLSRRQKKQQDREKGEDMSKISRGYSEDDVVNSMPVPDALNLLTSQGRRELLDKLVTFDIQLRTSYFHQRVESTLCDLTEHNKGNDASDIDGADESDDPFCNDAERIICVVSVIGMHILLLRFQSISVEEMLLLTRRPWLRHLAWESVFAYLLWDCVPILEKKKCYDLAVAVLETILIGSNGLLDNSEGLHSRPHFNSFVRCLLSRRVRGKAFERLVIDQGHLERGKAKIESTSSNEDGVASVETNNSSTVTGKNKKRKQDDKKLRDEIKDDELCPPADLTVVQKCCLEVIDKEGRNSTIPFSAVRSLARRLKVPLKETINDTESAEMKILAIRSENDESTTNTRTFGSKDAVPKARSKSAYSEWTPITDFSVANSIVNEDKDGVGKRCAFVGWEDEDSAGMARTRSMNVEELALEEYAAGRLPNHRDDESMPNVRGGWVGWHAEGGHVRALFRILCAPSILRTDTLNEQSTEQQTIFLAPYQGAPLDLHVGFQGSSSSALSSNEQGEPRGFFERRRAHIDKILSNIESLSSQQICDRVYDSISERVEAVRKAGSAGMRDLLLCRDLGEIRTLSFIAAGLGGKMLAAIFRCLCFDYRHYAGGLPDLTLARAVYDDDDGAGSQDEEVCPSSSATLVDLGEWLGEAFSAVEVQKGEIVELCRVLADRDDEFLGCSKVGETGAGGSSQRWRQGQRRQKQDETARRGEDCLASRDASLPPRLLLSHNGRPIRAECMFVEVKSANDRLDARQEDWLNVLDGVGNARVCKFSKAKTQKGNKSGKKKTEKN